MRELTEKEKQLLVGGTTTLDYIVVTADYFWDDFGWGFELWNNPFDYTIYDDYYVNDGGGGGGGPAPCDSTSPTEVEAYVDQLASKLARDIIAKPDDSSREYMGIIYRDSHGTLRSTTLWGGTGDRVEVRFDNLGFPASEIVGIVHNHDKYHYGQTTYEADANRNPSVNDWSTADRVVAYGADPNTLALYVLDTQSAFRQYDYADKSKYLVGGKVTPSTPLGTTTSKTLEPSYCPS